MEMNRKGESGAVPFRSGRFFNISGVWYFSCRESLEQGPYGNRALAKAALHEHIKHCDSVEKPLQKQGY